MRFRYIAAAALICAAACTQQRQLPDDALLDAVEKATIGYFTDFADPATGLARERNNDANGNIVTIGGSGFGLMAIIAGAERGYYSREEGVERIEKIVSSLEKLERFHGAWAHWYNADTMEPFSFSKYDDGGDLVETAFMVQGLIAARHWLEKDNFPLAERCHELWLGVEWNWYTKGGTDTLYWHWSKNFGFKMNHPIRGYDETLITYILAASSPSFPISAEVYENTYKNSTYYYNGKEYYGITLPLGMELGGPLFFSHYSYLGLDPRGLTDGKTNYFERNKAHTLIHRAYAIDNPKGHKGYGEDFWGFTSSDDPYVGYCSHHPGTQDENGTVSPTAAISSIVYTPEESMKVIRHLYYDIPESFGQYGFYDAINLVAEPNVLEHYLAIDQGPEAVMIENYRSGLLWNLFMQAPEIRKGLEKLGFYYE
ncbi:MAG: DUF3131 domain-containing protein [Bacteroidales bacterium]|nr:DUF3131 domain-containing protein [Bacteroidales bacterium]